MAIEPVFRDNRPESLLPPNMSDGQNGVARKAGGGEAKRASVPGVQVAFLDTSGWQGSDARQVGGAVLRAYALDGRSADGTSCPQSRRASVRA